MVGKKWWKGNVPERGTLIAETRGWLLLDIGQKEGWVGLKLLSKISLPKGNFWLSWSVEDQRLAMGSDAKLLNEHLPDVFDWVEQVMRRHG